LIRGVEDAEVDSQATETRAANTVYAGNGGPEGFEDRKSDDEVTECSLVDDQQSVFSHHLWVHTIRYKSSLNGSGQHPHTTGRFFLDDMWPVEPRTDGSSDWNDFFPANDAALPSLLKSVYNL
jgi:hypothetical protein